MVSDVTLMLTILERRCSLCFRGTSVLYVKCYFGEILVIYNLQNHVTFKALTGLNIDFTVHTLKIFVYSWLQ